MFQEHNIDGAALPLLTEDHLTVRLGMKLGPALKLKSIVNKKLGQIQSILDKANIGSSIGFDAINCFCQI